MLTDAQPRATVRPVADVDHAYCCNPDVALCGADISDLPYGREFPDTCLMCQLADDEGWPCPHPDCPDRER